MPRILIREIDKTTVPDSSGQVYSVLIPGFVKSDKSDEWKKIVDGNGVAKIKSTEMFDAYVGDVAYSEANKSYGNTMAKELLKLGYQVYYKAITAVSNEETNALSVDGLEDKTLYNFRFITSGLLTAEFDEVLAKLAEARGDCTAILDIAASNYTGKTVSEAITAIKTAATQTYNNKNTAWIAPYINYTTNTADKLPGAFHYLACAINALKNYPEWFAVAGTTRGKCDLKIVSAGYKFGDAAVRKLQPRQAKKKTSGGYEENVAAVNLITCAEENNYYIWGNRTAQALAEGLIASHFLNIRQLCTTLKKEIYSICRNLTFDPNSELLYANFCNALVPLLENMKAKEGIRDYKLIKLTTQHKGKLFVMLRIVPIEAVEDFEIGITLEDNLDDTTVTIDEELVEYDEDD